MVHKKQLIFKTNGQRIWTEDHIVGWGDFSRGQCNVTPTSREHCSRLQKSRCHAVIENWMIPFAAYTTAETPDAFQWAGQLPKIAYFRGDLESRLPSNTWFFWPTRVSPLNGISIGLAVSAGHICVTNTQTQTTLRVISVAIGRIYAMHVMMPSNDYLQCNTNR